MDNRNKILIGVLVILSIAIIAMGWSLMNDEGGDECPKCSVCKNITCPECLACPEPVKCSVCKNVTCPECPEQKECPEVKCPECEICKQCPNVTCPECPKRSGGSCSCPACVCPECSVGENESNYITYVMIITDRYVYNMSKNENVTINISVYGSGTIYKIMGCWETPPFEIYEYSNNTWVEVYSYSLVHHETPPKYECINDTLNITPGAKIGCVPEYIYHLNINNTAPKNYIWNQEIIRKEMNNINCNGSVYTWNSYEYSNAISGLYKIVFDYYDEQSHNNRSAERIFYITE